MSIEKFPTQDELLQAAGVNLTGPRADYVARRISNDHEVLDIAARLAAEHFVKQAVEKMTPEQRAKLVKRTQPEPLKPAQSTRVNWSVERSRSGEVHIFCTGPQRDMGNGAFAPCGNMRFTGAPEEAKTFRFMGAAVPPEILEEYRRRYRGPLWSLEKP
jgi:hypothetical protein